MKKHIGLIGAICGSLLVSFPAIAQTNPTNNRDVNQTPATGDRLSGTERDRICADYANQIRRMNRESRSVPTTSITQSLPEGSVNEPPATRDGRAVASNRFPDQMNVDREELCADYIKEQGINRDVPPAVENNTPSRTESDRTKQMRDSYDSMQMNNSRRIIPPTPEQQQPASSYIRPINGTVNLRLVNETGADITYQVIGDTNTRTLQGEDYISLQNLDTPVNITFYRPDRGFLTVRPRAISPGVLEVRFAETTDFGMDKTAMTVQPSGAVYLN